MKTGLYGYGVTRTTMFETPDGVHFRSIDSAHAHCATFGYDVGSIEVVVFFDDIY